MHFLHISCSHLPHQITHPFDQNHILSFLCTPIYPEGIFSSDACGKQRNGFSYHCGIYNIDLHTLCATMPLLLNHQTYHHHNLNLTFFIPYPDKSFICDICNNLGSKQWFYVLSM
ncbi:uncharacterized protein LOC119370046 [Jatropha curcas]|uniref:uncharacterized protein LOC119370046 n=1 Tax=Jatropha curcas TaxID=180498 RepID=UPI0018944A42|nr:uncharacterized protein LOC119370046 [Jatropha curcas]